MKKMYLTLLVVLMLFSDAGIAYAQASSEGFILDNQISERGILLTSYKFSSYPPATYRGKPLIRAENKGSYYVGYYKS
ncbi:hypothetical protein [Enterococcus sp. RIT-PI-f]|uniref:hypothetical protein n=1 Tax=Enterococcus sp. RIT-PI-f TaxID=1690244 RepID=UPI0006B905FF|nr:hypothetical protein [Enterococcus sp. RIT-PI-f]KPG69476.1 hypothetical protein AEQ18_12285 [Enterococcus sp. RIT-PI-f]